MVVGVSMAGFAGYLVKPQLTPGGSVSGRISLGVMSLVALFTAAVSLWFSVQRFQVGVDGDGWTVRIGRYRRDVPWTEISAVVIENQVREERRGRPLVAALYLVPEPGVSLDAPSDMDATVDGRPAVRLFDLDEVKNEKKQLVRELAGLAGDRLAVRVFPLGLAAQGAEFQERVDRDAAAWLNAGRSLPAFPPGVEGVRTLRWLNRRRALLFAGWYLCAVVPALLLTGFAAEVHELLGAVVAVLGLIAVVAAYFRFVRWYAGATDLLDDQAAIFGTELVLGIGNPNRRHDMHAGKAVVLPPGTERGYGKAWLLGFPRPVTLLGDPRTGRLRDHDHLGALSAVLRESPHEADRIAAREIDSLAVQSQLGDPPEAGDPANARLWTVVTRAGRTVAWAVVVGSVLLAGDWIWQSHPHLGNLVIFLGVLLIIVWAPYTLYRVFTLLGAVWKAMRRNQ
ncbi:hypothetical protein L3i22_068170 [Actinoplanes sp. L3-i22]|nr:hypothetical protein L3i22_068170 [Actinoplanes sp. L3-i22]